ncbi:MAG TPA: RluA family pseudouridine synthase [Desulfobulbaceae bacterium]|nr:RluA family pseudouridine synthase [Desulfobulbaceae bacterium]
MSNDEQHYSLAVTPDEAGLRLDHFLVQRLADYSRSALRKLIRDGLVTMDGEACKAGCRLRSGDGVEVVIPSPPPSELIPEQIDFRVLHEDDSLLVLVKPPGLVVHPAAGHRQGTLAHGLLYHCASLPGTKEQRPGIVHRLDKDTSGVMLVAKTETALRQLTADFQSRNIRKTYHAVLLHCPAADRGRVVAAIGRHPVQRKKMAIRAGGRHAATCWRVVERYPNGMGLMELDLETGRTHQIRVHMASLGCPVAGDDLYGGRVPPACGLEITRQLLHASTLGIFHPVSREPLEFAAPLWPDMMAIVEQLRTLAGGK